MDSYKIYFYASQTACNCLHVNNAEYTYIHSYLYIYYIDNPGNLRIFVPLMYTYSETYLSLLLLFSTTRTTTNKQNNLIKILIYDHFLSWQPAEARKHSQRFVRPSVCRYSRLHSCNSWPLTCWWNSADLVGGMIGQNTCVTWLPKLLT